MPSDPTLDHLRRYAVARTLFTPTTLPAAIRRLGFVQADPIRAPARAQDLTLRHRVRDYRAGDLESRYARLAVEEDCLVNYGFLPREHLALMHPREAARPWDAETGRKAAEVLAFVREHGPVHPRAVELQFAHGRMKNYWGGSSNASTHLLDDMHYRGWLRVTRRHRGIRQYAVHAATDLPHSLSRQERLDRLVDVVANKYAPLPALSLAYVIRRLRYAVPQWRGLIPQTLTRARQRLPHERIDGIDWYWPAGESPLCEQEEDAVRLLAPFDPIVWDRRRFELLWRWPYRFEAYTPAAKRRFGYYAMPVLWRGQVIGWANVSVVDRTLRADLGYVAGSAPRDRAYKRELDAELQRMRRFLGL